MATPKKMTKRQSGKAAAMTKKGLGPVVAKRIAGVKPAKKGSK